MKSSLILRLFLSAVCKCNPAFGLDSIPLFQNLFTHLPKDNFPPRKAPAVPRIVTIEKGRAAIFKNETGLKEPLFIASPMTPGREMRKDMTIKPSRMRSKRTHTPMVIPITSAPFQFARAFIPPATPPIKGPSGPVTKCINGGNRQPTEMPNPIKPDRMYFFTTDAEIK